MANPFKVPQGTPDWFEKVGQLMVEAGAALPPHLNLSLVERYTDGSELSEGFIQGIRFDIREGKPSFRVGVGRDERGDVTVEVTAAAARELNSLHSDDPKYQAARKRVLDAGEMQVHGDPSPLNDWLEAVHDPIVDLTA